MCFTCQEPWVPGHGCVAGRVDYIEVFSDFEEEKGNDGPRRGHNAGHDEEEDQSPSREKREPFL